MNKLIALFLPSAIKGYISTSQKFLDGKKSYLAGVILILQGLFMLVSQYIGCADNNACILSMVSNISSNEGTLVILNGLAVCGLRHAVEKSGTIEEVKKEDK